MCKNLFYLIVALLLTFGILDTVGCNRQVFDFQYKFNKAMLRMPDGTCKVVKVSKWCDYDGSDQIQIIADDGTVYLGHSCNIFLIKESK